MNRSTDPPWLGRYALFTAMATLVLICFGGLVTSHEAGMAVPDWPNTYGHNMFFFPISKWVGGIFYEHTHRLVASGVAFMTIILAIWLWLRESRRWVRWLGVVAVAAVILQGVLGGLRVVLLRDELGVVHATIAQLFLVLMCSIALLTGGWWRTRSSQMAPVADVGGLRWRLLFATALVLFQLVLGATMRHRHAGLAIPDFPTAYGRLWPLTDASAIAKYNRDRVELRAVDPITRLDVWLQMAHRATALAVLIAVATCAAVASRGLGKAHWVTKWARRWTVLIVVQLFLGAATVWTGKSADVATAHVAVGSLALAAGGLLTILGFRTLCSCRWTATAFPEDRAHPGQTLVSPFSIASQ